MPYVIRPTDAQRDQIARLIEATDQRTASKALLVAARDYPAMQARIEALEAEASRNDVASLRLEMGRLAAAVRETRPNILSSGEIILAEAPTFAEVAAEYLETRTDLTAKALRAWTTTLGYCTFPDVAVNTVSVDDVRDSVLPRWSGKRSVGDKMLSRIGAVFAFAIAKGHRTGNPAIDAKAILPRVKASNGHHHSLHHSRVGDVLRAVSESDARAQSINALKLLALTAARSGEVRGASPSEFDLDARVWTIPASRMKAGKPHTIPLSDQAVAVVREAAKTSNPSRLLPGVTGMLMGDRVLSRLMREHGDSTAHGLRSSFKSWAIERGFRREAVELSLSHSVGLNSVEAAYVQTDLLAERRELMAKWADYIVL